jgi:hypothetical protein
VVSPLLPRRLFSSEDDNIPEHHHHDDDDNFFVNADIATPSLPQRRSGRRLFDDVYCTGNSQFMNTRTATTQQQQARQPLSSNLASTTNDPAFPKRDP